MLSFVEKLFISSTTQRLALGKSPPVLLHWLANLLLLGAYITLHSKREVTLCPQRSIPGQWRIWTTCSVSLPSKNKTNKKTLIVFLLTSKGGSASTSEVLSFCSFAVSPMKKNKNKKLYHATETRLSSYDLN